jgi:PAS domain S-box-containing protein
MDSPSPKPRRLWLIFLLVLVPVLFLLGWSQASLNLSFLQPGSPSEMVVLLAVSTFIFLSFVIFLLILLRILLKLYVERRQQKLGAHFKTKLVAAFLGLSLVPVFFLFIFSYGLLNRSIDKWFGIPFDAVRRDAMEIFRQVDRLVDEHAVHHAQHLADSAELRQHLAAGRRGELERALGAQLRRQELSSIYCFDLEGRLVASTGAATPGPEDVLKLFPALRRAAVSPEGVPARWRSEEYEVALAAAPVFSLEGAPLGAVVSAVRVPADVRAMAENIQREAQKYDELSRQRKAVKVNYLAMLWLLTLLILFVAAWFAMFLSKQVTVPIQALAQATHEVSKGNLAHRVEARSDDELGTLIQSFNEMTRQLQENRQALEQAALDLQRANRDLEERTRTLEAILENVATGVISFDPQGRITQVNSTVERMMGRPEVRNARTVEDLFKPEDAREIARLFRRAARQGVVTRQMELDLGGRQATVALTLSSIRGRHETLGSVLVIDDLTELLRAQRAAAWQEVAQRIAHEIKNPLTPIQLSTERIRRLIERDEAARTLSPELVTAVADSVSLIGREVATLKTLVDEFSDFARFPASRPRPSDLNDIVSNALEVFDGRLDGIRVHTELAPGLPPVAADPDQMKRAVVNLIDNAAEALERAPSREIWVRTALDDDRDVVELVVADSGPGISPEAKEHLFLPFYSTKRRGTGLGLAIVSRIVSEHHGTIRVEENVPAGTKFVIELPVERVASLGAQA